MIEAYHFYRLGCLMELIETGMLVHQGYLLGTVQYVTEGLSIRSMRIGTQEPIDLERLITRTEGEPLSAEWRGAWKGLLERLQSECQKLHLKASLYSIRGALEHLKDEEATLDLFKKHCEQIAGRLADELRETVCVAIDPMHAKFLSDNQLPFGSEVADRFPRAQVDIEEAGICLAFHRGTACVFHLMRVLEVALQVLGADLNIPKPDRNWQNLLNEIDKAVKGLPYQSQADKDARALRSEAAVQSYFRKLWIGGMRKAAYPFV